MTTPAPQSRVWRGRQDGADRADRRHPTTLPPDPSLTEALISAGVRALRRQHPDRDTAVAIELAATWLLEHVRDELRGGTDAAE